MCKQGTSLARAGINAFAPIALFASECMLTHTTVASLVKDTLNKLHLCMKDTSNAPT